MTTPCPKPGKKLKKKATREKDLAYVRFVHGYACVVCGSYPVHAHHVFRRSQGGTDRSCVPLCNFHHTGQSGIHILGVKTWAEKFKIDLDIIVKEMNSLYEDGKAGPHS